MSDLIEKLQNGCVYPPTIPIGHCPDVDEAATDSLMLEAAEEIARLRDNQRTEDCVWSYQQGIDFYRAACNGDLWHTQGIFCPDCGGKVVTGEGE